MADYRCDSALTPQPSLPKTGEGESVSRLPSSLLRLFLLSLFVLLLYAPAMAFPPRDGEAFTQHRINELAAACVTTQMAMSGLKGTRRPEETPAQFTARIRSYFAALDEAVKSLQPLRRPPTPHDAQQDNLQRWQRLSADVNRLPAEIGAARAAWAAVPKQGEKAPLGPKLARALATVQTILNGLRDARP